MRMEDKIREAVGEERYQIYQAQLQGEAVRELAGDDVVRFQALKMPLQPDQLMKEQKLQILETAIQAGFGH